MQTPDSPTPESDEAAGRIFDTRRSRLLKMAQLADFARQLERQRNAALAENAKLRGLLELSRHALQCVECELGDLERTHTCVGTGCEICEALQCIPVIDAAMRKDGRDE